jgi:hypothetical protein
MSKTIRKHDSKGNPRTKGMRNPFVEYAQSINGGGPHRDSRDKRNKRANEWKRDQHEQG